MTGSGFSRRRVLQAAGLGVLVGCSAPSHRRASPSPATATSPMPPTGTRPGPTRAPQGLAALSAQLSSPLLLPGSPGYAGRVRLYNPRFDATRHPVAIADCRTPADVAACVRFAGQGSPALHLRAGGHSYGGWSSGPGLVADVSSLSAVVVDTAAGTARIGAGARLAEVYDALSGEGVALAAGSCPTVGLTGLALGGGVGVLARAFGLTCDALRSVQLVTADGVLRDVDARREPDLFWALRGGGGGSFGAVTALTVAVRPAPTVHTFFLAWDGPQAPAVLTAWQRWQPARPPELWSTCKLLADPARGRLRIVVAGTWVGPADGLSAQLQALRAVVGAPPTAASTQTLSYGRAMQLEAGCSDRSVAQCVSDALSPAKRQPFAATSAVLSSPLPDAGVAAAVAAATAGFDVPRLVEGGISFDALGGAVADVAAGDTAFVHRQALATVQYTATWSDGGQDPAPFDAHVRSQRAALLPWTGTAAYANYADPAMPEHGAAYWGRNYPRLQAVKKQYDAHALFSFPQGVQA